METGFIKEKMEIDPMLKKMREAEEVIWLNPDKIPFADARDSCELTMADIEDAEARLLRFAPFIMKCFPGAGEAGKQSTDTGIYRKKCSGRENETGNPYCMGNGRKPCTGRNPGRIQKYLSPGEVKNSIDKPHAGENNGKNQKYGSDCQVYLNEYYIGSHSSGYTSFWFDITDFVDEKQENLLAVKVDATGREGWWYEGGGIYRHVRMEIRNPVHFAPSGIFVSSQVNLEEKSAVVTVKSEIRNKRLTFADIRISLEVGKEGANGAFEPLGIRKICPLAIPAWEDGTIEQTVPMKDVALWSFDHPSLYQLRMRILRGDAVLDEEYTTFGIREIRFEADTGFYLNGESVKIKGVCCHQDHASVGIGMPDAVTEYRMRKIKEMGANAYRCAHHQQSRELLDICDRLGLLVMCETRRMSSAEEDLEELRTLVRRDRNHPSVFLWGIGNEEIFSQDRPETAKTTRTIKAEIQKLDPTRHVTSAVVCWNGKERFDTAEKYIPVTRYLDIMGFNYCRTAWDDYHARIPKQPILVTEIDSNSWTRGCYATDESVGQYYLLDPDNHRKCKNGNKAVKKDVAETAWAMIDARETTGAAASFSAEIYRSSVKKDDIAILNIELLDAYSRLVPDADTELHFEISGGRLLGTGNGNPGSHESEKLPVRRAFHGKCQLIIDTQGKKTTVKLYAQGLKDLTLSV